VKRWSRAELQTLLREKAPRSIARRLLLASLIGLPLFLAATGWFLAKSFEASQLASAEERARIQFYALLSTLEFDRNGIQVSNRNADPRLAQINSGLYAVIHRPNGLLLWQSPSSQALVFDEDLLAGGNPPEVGTERFDTLDNVDLLRYQFQTIYETDDGEDLPLVFTILESQDNLRAEQRAFLRQLWLGLGGAAVLLTLAQAAILRWGLAPLRKLAQDVSDLEQGRRAALPEQYPTELQPLAQNLNQLLTREQNQRERYRNTLGDLAHSLKTPLAVLRQSVQGERMDHEQVEEQIARMDQLIVYQLQRAVASGAHRVGQKSLRVKPIADKLVASFSKVYFDKQVQLQVAIDANSACLADEGDVYEVLGNLIDNACKACRRQVSISAEQSERWLLISVEDDGVGIAPEARSRILLRGQRADSYKPGQGIGLAVAVDILDSYGAELDIGSANLGGARFTIRWPS
jgi:two-component system sensor histidine kinase PhoQ